MSIVVKSISYLHPDKKNLFTELSFSISKGQKSALIGNNGSGKSTLLKIIAGELMPAEGSVVCASNPWYVPQHMGQYDNYTVLKALGADKKWGAFKAILNGDNSVEHFEELNDDWDIEDRITNALHFWQLDHLDVSQPLSTLSGGEKTKVFLAGITIHSPSVILMDEPSNHLDNEARKKLYRVIEETKATMLIVSHDRILLNLLESTFELTCSSILAYGGNYDFYEIQKEEKLAALKDQLHENEKTLKQYRQKAVDISEQKQKSDVRGKKQKLKSGIPRIAMKTLKNQAEQSGAKLKNSQEEKLSETSEKIKTLREQIQKEEILKIDLNNSEIHHGKLLVEAREINFSYSGNVLWREQLSFQIRSGDRVRIEGTNGSGKTTLVNLLLGKLKATAGSIVRGVSTTIYIDQEYSLINNNVSVYEQAESFNTRFLPEHEVKILLNRCQFSSDTWNKKCDTLSGGEKMKLLLCCLLVSNNAPDLLVLDEPTNNLDLQSQKILTAAIKSYQGTLLVNSHNKNFIDEIIINTTIKLSN